MLRHLQGDLLRGLGQAAEAARSYRDLLKNPEPQRRGGRDRGVAGFGTRTNLALTLAALGDDAAAEAQWRRVAEEVPGYRPGWLVLGDCLLRQGKLDALADLIAGLRGETFLGEAALRSVASRLAARAAVA